MKRCPFCAEEIQDAAIVCRFCGRDVPRAGAARAPAGLEGIALTDPVHASEDEVEQPTQKTCPYCAKRVAGAARVCPHCTREIDPTSMGVSLVANILKVAGLLAVLYWLMRAMWRS